jgi:hypothetical protein
MMVRRKSENGILIKNMAASRWKIQVVPLIGGNKRMARWKDMEHSRLLMDRDTLGNT